MNTHLIPDNWLISLSLQIILLSMMLPATAPRAGAQDLSDVSLRRLEKQLSAPDAETRARAACALAGRDEQSEPAADALIELLSDDTPVPWDVCRDVGKQRYWNENRCSEGWRSCEDSTPGRKAAAALSDIGTPVVDRVEGVLADGNDHARRNAAWILGAVDAHGSVSLLIDALDDPYSEVRQRAAWALGAIGDKKAVDPLLNVFQNDENNDVRRKAMWAIRAIH